MEISDLFKSCHGPINFKNVVPLENANEFAEYFGVDSKFFLRDTKRLINPVFYFDGLVYIPMMSPEIETLKQFYKLTSESNHADMVAGFKKTVAHFHSLRAQKDYTRLFSITDKKILIKLFTELYNEIPDEQKYEIFVDLYVRSEFGFDLFNEVQLEDLFVNQRHNSKDWEKRMRDLKKLAKDKMLTIYHGYSGDGDVNDEMSWTLSRKTAQFFANRFNARGKIKMKIVKVEHVLDFFEQRGEQEVLLNIKKYK
jgi:hypothetical protein